uniref:Uncharacterized protein n=1 Tax=Anopheles merus TaxID=30066 RepID=A0A182VMP9_ANOME
MDAGLVAVHRVQHDLARLVHLVVGELDLLERDHLPPQRIGPERSVRMGVEASGRRWVGLARHQPGGAVVRVAVAPVIERNDIEQHGVPIGRRLMAHWTGERDANGWEHARSSSDTLAGVEAVRECVSRGCSVLSSESLQSSTLTLISSSAASDERSGGGRRLHRRHHCCGLRMRMLWMQWVVVVVMGRMRHGLLQQMGMVVVRVVIVAVGRLQKHPPPRFVHDELVPGPRSFE